MTVEIPEDTVIDNDDEGKVEAEAEAEDAPAPKPRQGPAKVDLSNKEPAKAVEWVECEWCGKRVKKGGYGKHVANLAGDGIHPFKEELQAARDAPDSYVTNSEPEEEKSPLNEPWVIAIVVGIIALVAMVLFIAFTRKPDQTETSVQVTVPAATTQVAPAAETNHASEPAMVEDANGNQVPVRIAKNADGTYSLAP